MSSTTQNEKIGVVDPARIVESPRLSLSDRYLCLLLALITFGLYFCTRKFDFVQFDDPAYVSQNIYLRHGITLVSLHWAFTAIVVANWHPLTLLTELVISTLFGPSAHTFHLANTLFHTANTVLLFVFFRKSTHRMWPAFFIAALWACHPLRAESVAWISELKDVLCAFFWLLCMLAYRRHVHHRTIKSYLVVVLLLVLALLAKPMAVTLPLALLLLDFWPLSNASDRSLKWFTRRALEKLPMLGLCLGIVVTSILTQKGYVGPLSPHFTLSIRIENAVIATCDYLRDMVLPRQLGIFYVHPLLVNQTIPLISVRLGCLLLIAISAVAVWRWKSNPYLLIGWLWFLGTLVPVIGLVRAGDQQRADRYTYLPSIGIFASVVFLVSDLALRRAIPRVVAIAGGCAALLALLIASGHQINKWQNTRTLFTALRDDQPDNYMALSYYADELKTAGDVKQAVKIATRAADLAPGSPTPQVVLSMALCEDGQLDAAAEHAIRAIKLSPGSSQHWDVLGRVSEARAKKAEAENKTELALKEHKQAIFAFRKAVEAAPDDPQMLEHLAFQLVQVPGNLDEAISYWQQAVKLSPEYAMAQGDLADALLLKGDLPGAVTHFQATIDDGSKNPNWETKLAWLVATSPQATPADVLPMVDLAKDACDQTSNHQPNALDAYAACLARVARYDDAVTAAQQAIAQANAAHQPAIAAGIAKRLALYQNQQIYVAESPTTGPTTLPVLGPTTLP